MSECACNIYVHTCLLNKNISKASSVKQGSLRQCNAGAIAKSIYPRAKNCSLKMDGICIGFIGSQFRECSYTHLSAHNSHYDRRGDSCIMTNVLFSSVSDRPQKGPDSVTPENKGLCYSRDLSAYLPKLPGLLSHLKVCFTSKEQPPPSLLSLSLIHI